MAINVSINRLAAFLAPQASEEGRAVITGLMKLFVRHEGWGSVPARDAALVLTRSEQGVLLRGGVRFLVKWGARAFLVGAVLDFARRLISGSGEKPTIEARLEIIQAHIVKGGPLWSRAIGVSEQVVFLLLDSAGDVMKDTLAGALSTFDTPGLSTGFPVHPGFGDYYAELATPVERIEEVDSIFEYPPSITLQPALLPFPQPAVTFPSGPNPSFGRRS